MSGLADKALTSGALALAATEECARLGHTRAGLEHLFLAVLGRGGPAARLLGAHGVTLADARDAVTRVHAARLASLGVTAPDLTRELPDRIGAEGVETDDRVGGVLGVALAPSGADDRDLLRALVDDEGGLVRDVLGELGLDADAVRAATVHEGPEADADAAPEDADVPAVEAAPPSMPGWRTISRDGVVPAPVGEVWALVATPSRRMEWDGVLLDAIERRDDGVQLLHLSTTRPDGRRIPLAPSVTVECRVLSLDPGSAISWSLTPTSRRAVPEVLTVQLQADGDATRVRISVQTPRLRGPLAWIGAPARPLAAGVQRMRLVTRLAGISRRLS